MTYAEQAKDSLGYANELSVSKDVERGDRAITQALVGIGEALLAINETLSKTREEETQGDFSEFREVFRDEWHDDR